METKQKSVEIKDIIEKKRETQKNYEEPMKKKTVRKCESYTRNKSYQGDN